MAIQFRKKYGTWRVYWKNPYTGRQQSETCKTEAEAQKLNALVAYQLQYEKERFLPSKEQEPKPDNSLEAVFYAYLKEKQPDKKTLRFFLDGLNTPLSLFGRQAVTAITEQDLAKDLQAEQDKDVSGRTVYSRVGRLYTVLRWAYKRGILDRLPRFPERPSYHCKKFVPPSEEELVRIIEAASPHIQRLVIIGAKLGLRVGPSELLKLRWEDVDLEKGLVIVHAARKNPEEPFREVPIRDDLLPLFKAWHAQDAAQGLAYVITYKGKPVSHIKTAWTATLRRAGITRTIRPYDLRHAFATDAIAGGADLGTVAKLLGHTSVQMVVKHYQHVATKQKRQAVESLPAVEDKVLWYAAAGMPRSNRSPLQ